MGCANPVLPANRAIGCRLRAHKSSLRTPHAAHFDYRLPEVFAGFARDHTGFPVVYPTASSPQAWAAATPVLLLQAVLRLVRDRVERVLRSQAPYVPEWLEGISLAGVRAFGRRWAVRVENRTVGVEPTSAD